jgi:hypothetical protein
MPLKGEARTKYMRDYMRRKRAAEHAGATTKASPDPAPVLKAAKAFIAELEEKLEFAKQQLATSWARSDALVKELAAAKAKHSKPDVADDDEVAAAGPVGKKVFKILLKLDDANDNTVLVAARTLVSNLKASGSDLRTLADAMGAAWEKEQKAKTPPPPNIDWPEVEAAVTRYAADRATVKLNALLKVLYAEITALKANRGWSGNQEAARYIMARLRRLGFTGSSSGLTWSKPVRN